MSNDSNKMVCLVDDDMDIVMLFRDALRKISGITVFTFTEPVTALEHFLINKHEYILVISDFKMLGLNGIELLKRVRDLSLFVRTVLMTAFEIDDEIFKDYIKKKIINAFLQKPIRIPDLVTVVETQIHDYETQNFRSQLP